jgi:hypothetical protein
MDARIHGLFLFSACHKVSCLPVSCPRTVDAGATARDQNAGDGCDQQRITMSFQLVQDTSCSAAWQEMANYASRKYFHIVFLSFALDDYIGIQMSAQN